MNLIRKFLNITPSVTPSQSSQYYDREEQTFNVVSTSDDKKPVMYNRVSDDDASSVEYVFQNYNYNDTLDDTLPDDTLDDYPCS
jgi:hypothetical protein